METAACPCIVDITTMAGFECFVSLVFLYTLCEFLNAIQYKEQEPISTFSQSKAFSM